VMFVNHIALHRILSAWRVAHRPLDGEVPWVSLETQHRRAVLSN
jgi:hypothetical protein